MIGTCERCGDDIEELNVESWEETGAFLCGGCADEAFERATEDDPSISPQASQDATNG